MADEVAKVHRVENRYFADSEGRRFTMMTDVETGETEFLGQWTFNAKVSDGKGNIFERPDERFFVINVDGQGKSAERIIKAFEAFDAAKEACLNEMNKGVSKLRVIKNG